MDNGNGSCHHSRVEVVDSRRAPVDGFVVVRCRRCLDCKEILFTREVIDITARTDIRMFYKVRCATLVPTGGVKFV